MNKIGMCIVGASVLALAGCSTTASVTTATTSTTQESIASTVQAEAVKLCKFLPAASSIAAILTAGDPRLQLPADIAKAICNAVTNVKFGAKFKSTAPDNYLPVIFLNGHLFVVEGTKL